MVEFRKPLSFRDKFVKSSFGPGQQIPGLLRDRKPRPATAVLSRPASSPASEV